VTGRQSTGRGTWPWIALGLLAGAGALHWLLAPDGTSGGFAEREEFFPRASAADVATWREQLEARAGRWRDVPDPPGAGRLVVARYWLSRAVYDMEVRRRGSRFVVAIGGVDPQFMGGGWTAVGEGRISGEAHGFRDAVATFTWSCLSVRYRHMSDGVGRIRFAPDGDTVAAVYMAWESPTTWAKAYGRRQVEGERRPPYAALRGQIPYTPAMARLADDAEVTVHVEVVDERGAALDGALVQLKATEDVRTLSTGGGRATLRFAGRRAPFAQVITAGLPGHRNAETAFFAEDTERHGRIVLARLPTEDHPTYSWNRAAGSEHPDDLMACGTCHEWHFTEWHASRHGRSADNGHVTYERQRMLEARPDAPDDCVGCHQPALAVSSPDARWKPRGPLAGNHCDVCHKIADVLDVRESGVLGALRVLRPDPASGERPGGIHHVFGPLADSTFAYMGASYSPLFGESRLCAGCHQGGGRWRDGSPPKIDTYEEWRAWVADKEGEAAKQCQDCHMPGASTLSSDGKLIDQLAWDGLHRPASQVHSHRFDAVDAQFASSGFQLDVEKSRDTASGDWIVRVAMTNSGAGHKIPTGSWSKQVVVGVWAATAEGPLACVGGARAWLDPRSDETRLVAGDWRNPAGFVLGMRAASDAEGRRPTPDFWQPWPPDQVVDTRLAPGERRSVACRFEATPEGVEPVVDVRVLHRRAWLPRGAAGVPWTIEPYDPAPETLWRRVIR
jgi:hypothetical protein